MDKKKYVTDKALEACSRQLLLATTEEFVLDFNQFEDFTGVVLYAVGLAKSTISYTYGDYPEFSTGYFDEALNWHEGKYVPEYFELLDALNLPNLKQPEIELSSPYKNAKML